MQHINDWGNREAWENSVEPLAELLHDNTHLSPQQATDLARRILDLAEPDKYGE